MMHQNPKMNPMAIWRCIWMNLNQVKETLYEVTEQFFRGASVIWAEQLNTKPKLPYLTIKVGSVQRRAFPVDDPDAGRCYHCSTIMEVNLYTQGQPITIDKNATGNYANTAVSDLLEFSNYLESDAVVDSLASAGIDIALNLQVRDLSAIENDSRYRYRAMAEYAVTFAEEASGKYGIGGMPATPNYSGGGTHSMALAEVDTIESVEFEENT
jgi:hypothetical protein